MMAISVFVVDDHELMRIGLREALEVVSLTDSRSPTPSPYAEPPGNCVLTLSLDSAY